MAANRRGIRHYGAPQHAFTRVALAVDAILDGTMPIVRLPNAPFVCIAAGVDSLDKPRKLTEHPISDVGFPRSPRLARPTGEGLEALFNQVARVEQRYRTTVATPALNRALKAAVAAHQPPTARGRAVRMLYATPS